MERIAGLKPCILLQMSKTEKLKVSIYKLDKTLPPGYTNLTLLNSVVKYARDNGLTLLKKSIRQSAVPASFEVTLYLGEKSYTPVWRKFLAPVVPPKDLPLTLKNLTHTFLLFLEYNGNLYACCGGQGSVSLNRFADDNFGLEILSILIDDGDKVIKGIQERGITGSVLGTAKYYRGDQMLADEDQFGKILKQVQAQLPKSLLIKELGFTTQEVRQDNAGCVFKASFTVNKVVDFSQLLNLVSKLDEVAGKPKKFIITKVRQISKQHGGDYLLSQLEKEFSKTIYLMYKTKNDLSAFDLCNTDLESYLMASKYELIHATKYKAPFQEAPTLKKIIKRWEKDSILPVRDEDEFFQILQYYQLNSFSDSPIPLTGGSILDHLHGEIIYQKETYFRVDKKWYQLDPNFIKQLNTDCQRVIDQHWNKTLLTEEFDLTKIENEFNKLHLPKPDCLVLDKVLPENIEFCDILKWDSTNAYVIHVKKGFDASMRELCAQILISARRLLNDIKSDFSFVQKVEDKVRSFKKSTDPYFSAVSVQAMPDGDLSTFFRKKRDQNIVFCLAVVDDAAVERSIKDALDQFQSNVAKFEMIMLSRQLRDLGFGFAVIQIYTK